MKLIFFAKRQINQIQHGGWMILWHKLYHLWERSTLNIFAEIAVKIKIDWLQAYRFVGEKNVQRFFKLCEDNSSEKALRGSRDKAKSCLEKYISHNPERQEILGWIRANINLGNLLYQEGYFKKYIDLFQQAEKIRREAIRWHQLDKLDIEFIPIAVATGCIGTYENLNAYIKIEMLGLRPKKKLFLLLDQRSPVNNRCYLEYWSRYITIISDPKLIRLLTPLEQCLVSPITFWMSFEEKTWVSHIALGVVQEKWDRQKKPALLTLSTQDHKRGWTCLRSFGVPQDAWFVCLHVRESGWNDYGSKEDDYRNANIGSYIPAIESITAAGGWVVRMGDSSMTPLPKMPRVIDYALSDAKSDWMDVFLCAQCRFIIGTSSGLFTLASAFGVPAVLTNFFPVYAMYCLSSRDMFLPGLCRSKDKNRFASFNELLSPPSGIAASLYSYNKLNLEIIKNTSEEIKGIIEEMLDRCSGKVQYSAEDDSLQEKFKAIAAKCGKEYGDEDIRVNARIGREFLRKHSSLLGETEEFKSSRD